jgi:hypothetical protein
MCNRAEGFARTNIINARKEAKVPGAKGIYPMNPRVAIYLKMIYMLLVQVSFLRI